MAKAIIIASFGNNPETTLRYLVNGNSVKGPNPDKFGAKTRADIAVPQIEEDLYVANFEMSGTGKMYVVYSQG